MAWGESPTSLAVSRVTLASHSHLNLIELREATMHPARLAYLASNHAPKVQITNKTFTPSGWKLALSCGHSGSCVPHMTPDQDWSCRKCGEVIVKTAPQYSGEFTRI